jgi:uncharacterized protein (DUF488 family)
MSDVRGPRAAVASPTIYTVGHSTRSLEELVSILREPDVGVLVDVRRFPGSRRYPHFSRDHLEVELPRTGIAYRHEPELGGRRAPQVDSVNGAWRNPQFRGYADHMREPAFGAALDALLTDLGDRRAALMCSEAHPARCHRRLLADALLVRGWEVVHLIDPGRSERHTLNPDARLDSRGGLSYPKPRGSDARTLRAHPRQGELEFE